MPELKKILDQYTCPSCVTLETVGRLLWSEMLPEGPRQVWVTVIGVSTSGFSTVIQVRLRRVEMWTAVDGVRVMCTLGVGTENGMEQTIVLQSGYLLQLERMCGLNFLLVIQLTRQ